MSARMAASDSHASGGPGKKGRGNMSARMAASDSHASGGPGKKGRGDMSARGSRRKNGQNTGAGSKTPVIRPEKAPGKAVWKSGNMLYPLPVVMVSCARAGERPDIITVAWAGTICTDPAMVSISVRPSRYSYGIIDETGEFVINLVTEKLIYACDFCGVKSGRDTDKFFETGLKAVPASVLASAPLIAESPVNIECRVVKKLEPGSHHMFLARVEAVDIDEDRLDEKGRFELNRAGLIAYSHGEYFTLGKKVGTFGYSVRKKGGKR